jgi:hypothetical protein
MPVIGSFRTPSHLHEDCVAPVAVLVGQRARAVCDLVLRLPVGQEQIARIVHYEAPEGSVGGGHEIEDVAVAAKQRCANGILAGREVDSLLLEMGGEI